ncbi:MAG TPA: twin-arginine translocase TatA/TatE family subunit [Longimicrobiales bacterium]
MPFSGLGIWEVFLILLGLLLVFGPRRLPELGGALGKGIREFKRSVTDIRSELLTSHDEKKELKPASSSEAASGGAAQASAAKESEQKDAASGA